MEENTRQYLEQVNRRFYDRHGAAFASRRTRPWPGWAPLIESLRSDGLSSTARILDVGCGHGRFFSCLQEHQLTPEYVGVDQSLALLRLAANRSPAASDVIRSAHWVCADAASSLPIRRGFDLVVAFGLLHHIPSSRARVQLIQRLQSVVNPGGWLVLTFWFADSKRRGRAVGTESQIEGRSLDRGDVLFPWGAPGDPSETEDAVRYCHFFNKHEVDALAEAVGWGPGVRFRADGRENRENEYLVVRRPP